MRRCRVRGVRGGVCTKSLMNPVRYCSVRGVMEESVEKEGAVLH